MAVDADETYLSDLLSYSLERLNKEPEALANEETRLRDGVRDAAVRHYRAFVDAGGCYQSVRDEVRQIQRGLEAMRASLPELRAGCQRFAGRAEEISRARALNRRTLAAQGTLLDLLETPTLQETCLRHGNYDEALDLEALLGHLPTLRIERSRWVARQLLAQLRLGLVELHLGGRTVGGDLLLEEAHRLERVPRGRLALVGLAPRRDLVCLILLLHRRERAIGALERHRRLQQPVARLLERHKRLGCRLSRAPRPPLRLGGGGGGLRAARLLGAALRARSRRGGGPEGRARD